MNRIEATELLNDFIEHLKGQKGFFPHTEAEKFLNAKFNNSASDESPIVRGNKHQEKSSMQCCICGCNDRDKLQDTNLGIWCIDCIEDD